MVASWWPGRVSRGSRRPLRGHWCGLEAEGGLGVAMTPAEQMPLPQLVGPTTTLQDLDDYVESFGLHHLSVHWHTGDKKTGGLYEVHGGAGTLPHAGYGNTLADAVTAFFGAVVRARAAAAAEPPRERFADFVSKALEAFPDARVEEGPDGELVVYTNHRETKDGFVVPLKAEGKETP